MTNTLKERLNGHKNKKSFYTKQFSDIKLVYVERYSKKPEAVAREQQIKGWSHAKKHKLVTGKLGINTCTELVEALLVG